MKPSMLARVVMLSMVLGSGVSDATGQVLGGVPDRKVRIVEYDDRAWRPFTPTGGCVSLRMPGVPRRDRQAGSGKGTAQQRESIYTLTTRSVAYTVRIIELADPIADPKAKEVALATYRDQVIKGAGDDAVSEKLVSFAGRSGREIEIRGETTHVRTRFAAIENKVIALRIELLPGVSGPAFEIAEDRFLGSVGAIAPCDTR